MSRNTLATVSARVDAHDEAIVALTAAVTALTRTLDAAPAPVKPKAKSRARTFATKAERAAGKGFTCSDCGRTGLRTAPHEGSFHKAPDGSTHTI